MLLNEVHKQSSHYGSTLVDKEIQTVLNKETTMDIFDIMFKEKKVQAIISTCKVQ